MRIVVDKKIALTIFFDAILIVAGLFAEPATVFMFRNISDCIFAENGFLCPSCGGTRCIYSIANGDFAAAFSYNPYVFLMVIYALVTVLVMNAANVMNIGFCKRLLKVLTGYVSVIVLISGFAVFGILRNIVALV